MIFKDIYPESFFQLFGPYKSRVENIVLPEGAKRATITIVLEELGYRLEESTEGRIDFDKQIVYIPASLPERQRDYQIAEAIAHIVANAELEQ